MRNHRTGTRLCVRVTVAQPRVYVYTGNNGHFGPIAPLCASVFFSGIVREGVARSEVRDWIVRI